jgi:hypothetical protein
MWNKEKIRVNFTVVPQTANVTAKALDKLLMSLEKSLNFSVEDMNSKRVSVDGNVLRKIALSLYDVFYKEDGTEGENKPLVASRV